MSILTLITSPVEQFEVGSLLFLSGPVVGDLFFSITNFAAYSVIVGVIVVGLHMITDNGYRLIPTPWSVAVETVYASVKSFSTDQLGSTNIAYYPLLYSLFWVLMIANLSGNVPYGYTLTGSAVISIGLSVVIFIGVTLLGLTTHKLGFFAYFVPAGTPLGLVPLLVLIEVVSFFARAVSLGVRLAANIIAGHILLAILASFLYGLFSSGIIIATVTLVPFAIFTALIVLEIAVSIIQAYVFCTLVASYIHDAIMLH